MIFMGFGERDSRRTVIAGMLTSLLPFKNSESSSSKIEEVGPSELEEILQRNPLIVDVRMPNERVDSDGVTRQLRCNGCLTILAPHDISSEMGFIDPDKTEEILAASQNKPIVVFCQEGVRSRAAADTLQKNVKKVFTVRGGFNELPTDLKVDSEK